MRTGQKWFQEMALVHSILLVVYTIRYTVRTSVLLGRLLWDSQTIYAKVIADACDYEMRPSSVYNGCKDKVGAKIPKLKVGGDWPERRARDSEVRMVDDECAANHGDQHNSPVWKWLVCKMSQDNLGGHTSKDQ